MALFYGGIEPLAKERSELASATHRNMIVGMQSTRRCLRFNEIGLRAVPFLLCLAAGGCGSEEPTQFEEFRILHGEAVRWQMHSRLGGASKGDAWASRFHQQIEPALAAKGLQPAGEVVRETGEDLTGVEGKAFFIFPETKQYGFWSAAFEAQDLAAINGIKRQVFTQPDDPLDENAAWEADYVTKYFVRITDLGNGRSRFEYRIRRGEAEPPMDGKRSEPEILIRLVSGEVFEHNGHSANGGTVEWRLRHRDINDQGFTLRAEISTRKPFPWLWVGTPLAVVLLSGGIFAMRRSKRRNAPASGINDTAATDT